MRNTLGIFSSVFAEDGDRVEFGAFSTGWDADYSNPTSAKRPERTAMNDLFAKLTALGVDVNQFGAALPWNTNVAFRQYAVCTGSNGTLYRSKVNDNQGNDPTTDGGANWEVAAATVALLSAHADRTDNPHSVTKSQVGLGSADNTADLDKPISTLTQEALDLKCDKSEEAYTVTGEEVLRVFDFTDMADLTLAEQIAKICSVLSTLIGDLQAKGDFQ